MADVTVTTASHSYPIVVGTSTTRRTAQLIKKHAGSKRVFAFIDANVFALHIETVRVMLEQSGCEHIEFVIPPGEKAKSRATLARLYDFMLSHKVARDDLILAVGGGVTTDLVGYAAATTLRGLSWGVVATTLLGMVDAAIGGKTGINHPSGKNLIGAFWQPSFVVNDLTFLTTQSDRDFFSGMGEVVKYAGLIGEPMLSDVGKYLSNTEKLSEANIRSLVRRSAATKADIVSRDERESGGRMLLNLGHTFAHGIEKALGYGRLLHGEAVMIGLLAMCELSIDLKPSRAKLLGNYREICRQCVNMLPKRSIPVDKVLDAMQLDKKRSRRGQKFILLDSPGRPLIDDSPSRTAVRRACESAITQYTARNKR